MLKKITILSTLFLFLVSTIGYANERINRREEYLLTSEVQSIYLQSYNGAITWISIDENETSYIAIDKEVRGTDLDAMESFLKEITLDDASSGSIINVSASQPVRSPDQRGSSDLPYFPSGVQGSAVRFIVYAVPEIIQEFHGKVSNGSIQVEEFRGNLNLQTNNGSIALTSSEGQVTLRTLNGSISLDEVTLTDSSVVRVSNGHIQGSVVLPLTGSYTFRTASGNINLQMPADTMGNFQLKASLGTIDVQLGKDVFQERRSAQLFREHEPSISITTSNGNVVIREALRK